MFKVLLFATCVLLVKGQYGYGQYGYPQSGNNQPNPYQFGYTSPAEGGASSHQESGDGQGRVQGSYTVTDDDGRSRTVEYVADENGYRANVVTNEPGTSNIAPADVTISSAADEGAVSYSLGSSQYEPARPQYAPSRPQYAPSRPQYAPAPIQYAPARPQYAPARPQYAPARPQYAPAPLQYAPAPAYGNYGAYGGYGGGPQILPYQY